MADRDTVSEEETLGAEAVRTQTEAKLRANRVVRVTFGIDPKGNQRYERSYPGAKTNSSRKYSYLTDQEFKPGDHAVVETPNGYTLVTIQDVGPDLLFENLPGYKWVIDKVDIEGHENRKARAERRAFLMESLKQRAKEQKLLRTLEDDLFGDLAAKEMLEELKTL